MTAEEVIDFFAPEQYRVDQIMEWLSEAGISADRLSLSTNKQVRQPVPFRMCLVLIRIRLLVGTI